MRDFTTYLVQSGVATEAQVVNAIDRQRNSRPTIGRLAMTKGVLSGPQIFTILAYQARNPTMRFGEAAIALGMMTPRHVEELLIEQRASTTPIEHVLVTAGVITIDVAVSARRSFDAMSDPPEISRVAISVPRPTPTLKMRKVG